MTWSATEAAQAEQEQRGQRVDLICPCGAEWQAVFYGDEPEDPAALCCPACDTEGITS